MNASFHTPTNALSTDETRCCPFSMPIIKADGVDFSSLTSFQHSSKSTIVFETKPSTFEKLTVVLLFIKVESTFFSSSKTILEV